MTETLSAFDIASSVSAAYERIRDSVRITPVVELSSLNAPHRTRVFAKMENLQSTGSFKLRGATNRVMQLSATERNCGVVTASNGNHGLAVAAAAATVDIEAEVFVSSVVAPERAQRIAELGAKVTRAGKNPLDAELAARSAAEASGRTYIPPYNDPHVIAGQGTVAFELLEQLPQLDAVFITTGGGGLLSGMGAWIKRASPRTAVIGCWPENSRVLYESIRADAILDFPEQPTLSDSTTGGIEPGSITFPLARAVVDRSILVSEEEILAALRWAHRELNWIIEGAAGVALAAYIKTAPDWAGGTVAVIICGGNISDQVRNLI